MRIPNQLKNYLNNKGFSIKGKTYVTFSSFHTKVFNPLKFFLYNFLKFFQQIRNSQFSELTGNTYLLHVSMITKRFFVARNLQKRLHIHYIEILQIYFHSHSLCETILHSHGLWVTLSWPLLYTFMASQLILQRPLQAHSHGLYNKLIVYINTHTASTNILKPLHTVSWLVIDHS
jgi:hypothetical protein